MGNPIRTSAQQLLVIQLIVLISTTINLYIEVFDLFLKAYHALCIKLKRLHNTD